MIGFRAVFGSAAVGLVILGSARASLGAGSAPAVCGLVTRQEAAAALGAPVPAGREKAMDVPMLGRMMKAQFCFYGTEVSYARYDLGDEASELFGKYRQSLVSDSDYQSVKGVGDEAFFAKGQLAMRKGRTSLIIDVGQARGGGAKERAAEKSLALLALGRI